MDSTQNISTEPQTDSSQDRLGKAMGYQKTMISSMTQNMGQKISYLAGGALVGLGLMYYLDSARGSYRRNILRDKIFHWTNRSEDLSLRVMRDIQNRIRGTFFRIQHPMNPDVDDVVLESRVRSEFGKKVSHAKSISTEVHGGVVTLSGPILSSEVRPLVRCVRAVPGVRSVINRLIVQRHPDNISGLQGEGKQYLQ